MTNESEDSERRLYHSRSEIPLDGQRWDDVEREFSQKLSETAPHKHMGDKTPRFTKPHGEYLYARLKAVHDYCEANYGNLVTVWLSLTADEKVDGEWVDPLRHDDGFRSDAVKQALYRVRKSIDVKQWSGYWLMAPRKTGYSHKHYALWLDVPHGRRVSEEDLHPVIRSHVDNHPTATESGNQYGKAIQIRTGEECDGLPAEVGRNLPEVGPGKGVPSPDVRSITDEWEYVRIWCALYWFDDRIRSYELGEFSDIADEAKPTGTWEFGKGWAEAD